MAEWSKAQKNETCKKWHPVRAWFKETDLKSVGKLPRRFESCGCRFILVFYSNFFDLLTKNFNLLLAFKAIIIFANSMMRMEFNNCYLLYLFIVE